MQRRCELQRDLLLVLPVWLNCNFLVNRSYTLRLSFLTKEFPGIPFAITVTVEEYSKIIITSLEKRIIKYRTIEWSCKYYFSTLEILQKRFF